MQKQTFVVTLETLPPFDRYFPRIEPERMAEILRNAVQAGSSSFTDPLPFRISVERTDQMAWTAGQMRAYPSDEFEEAEQGFIWGE